MECLVIHDDIKRRLKAAKSSFKIVASDLGYSSAMVTMVSQGRRQNEQIEEKLADTFGTSVRDLWPNKFEDRGLPIADYVDRFSKNDIDELAKSGLLANEHISMKGAG